MQPSYAAVVQPIDEDRFSELVSNALDELPDDLWDRLSNVAVVVEDENAEEPDLLGLYEGIPQTDRWDYAGVLPDKISVYRLPLCEMCADERELMDEVKITVVHEVAHHLGISDDEVAALGWG
jgi:predicted Zn-dependent protease with MMP-like domain